MMLTEGFYWDRNDETRTWSKRFFERQKRMPTSTQAGEYSAVSHYLKAVQAAGTDETTAVMAKMRELPVNDIFAKDGKIRADGAIGTFDVPDAGKEAERVEVPMGLYDDQGNDSGRRGVSASVLKPVCAGEEIVRKPY